MATFGVYEGSEEKHSQEKYSVRIIKDKKTGTRENPLGKKQNWDDQ